VSGNTQLAAYLALHPDQDLETGNLRQHLKTHLPDYMIPATFTILGTLPLTPNGKIDRRALPDPTQTSLNPLETASVPRSHDETLMADIWKDLLGLQQVGIHDSFFDIGGHSLLSVKLMARIEDIFQTKIPLRALFETPTIAGLTGILAAARQQGPDAAISAGPQIDFRAETLLDAEIRPDTAPKLVLLTGGTGFLGAFLLYELLQQTMAHIYCLVRAESRSEGLERLRNNLTFFSLWNDDYIARIHPVPGDLGQPLLGLRLEEFTRLAEGIDVIYHNGALVNFVYPYSALKGVNVLGTQEVLRFAGQRRVKPVHYVSTLAVFLSQGLRSEDSVAEDYPLDEVDVDGLEVGYSQTKWVAEKLAEAARTRGIPVTVYRPGGIMGHSRTGACHTGDFVYSFLKGCIQLRKTPEQQTFFDITPVDYAAQAIVYLSLIEKSQNRAFHILNPQPLPWDDFVAWIRQYGYALEATPYRQWRQDLARQIAIEGNALEPFLPMFVESEIPPHERGPQRFTCRNTVEALAHTTIACPPPEASLLNTYFSYLQRSRFLTSPAASTRS
jgi:thioester reductase-like protein